MDALGFIASVIGSLAWPAAIVILVLVLRAPLRRLVCTGLDIYFESHGTGEPLVLIPGTGFAGNVWDLYQVPGLSKKMQVIIFDPRG